jgi:hypothetical protein
MKNNFNFKKILPHLIAIFIFLLVVFIYFSPVMSGKTLSMHDTNMAAGGSKELVDFKKASGEWAWWTNSMFGGMPSFMIAGGYPNSLSANLGAFFTNILPSPVNVIFLLMAGFYILMQSLRKNIWISVIGALAYGFGTYNLLFTEAGHISKIIALAYGPALLGGIVLVFRGKYMLGTFITALFLGLELYANHLQVTYYFIFIFIAYGIFELIKISKNKDFKKLLPIALSFTVALSIGIGMNGMRLWNNFTYAKETMRGKSELNTSKAGKDGLDKDYAFGWSYGINETVNLLIPNLMGGASGGSLDKSSATYQTLTSGGVDPGMASQFTQSLPLYHGQQSVTSGPSYSGIIIVFLFILGLFLSKSKFKWGILGLAIFFTMLSWGSNFLIFNDFVYSYLPGYNKFRAVTMTLTIVHFLLVWGAANTLQDLLAETFNWDNIKTKIYYSLGIIALIVGLGYFSVDFQGPNDSAFKTNLTGSLGADFSNKVLNAIIEDRSSMATSDIVRSLIFLILIFVCIYLFKKDKIKANIFTGVILILVLIDMISVGKRYFNNADFMSKAQSKLTFEPTPADLEILKDTDPNFRVLNMTTSFWSDARDSYFHKSIGGYHGAKLKKTQELFEYAMTKDNRYNLPIFNMLNTKYFITNDEKNNQIVQRNPDALGNVWFIDTLTVVDNADNEIKALNKLQPKTAAVAQFNENLKAYIYKNDISDLISLKKYAPNKLVYTSDAKTKQFAVFSEIYYRGNVDWKSYIDGKEVPHAKVNYVLRGMEIPAGKHEIQFEFKPESVEKGKYVDLASSIALVLLFGASIFSGFVKKKES